jgi:hypothetical protein
MRCCGGLRISPQGASVWRQYGRLGRSRGHPERCLIHPHTCRARCSSRTGQFGRPARDFTGRKLRDVCGRVNGHTALPACLQTSGARRGVRIPYDPRARGGIRCHNLWQTPNVGAKWSSETTTVRLLESFLILVGAFHCWAARGVARPTQNARLKKTRRGAICVMHAPIRNSETLKTGPNSTEGVSSHAGPPAECGLSFQTEHRRSRKTIAGRPYPRRIHPGLELSFP